MPHAATPIPDADHYALSITLLTAADAPEVLQFERENRDFFARWVPDRGEDYFEQFSARHQALVEENRAGTALLHLVRNAGGVVVGRVNLVDVAQGAYAELGYRIAEHAMGRGVATRAVAYAVDQARLRGSAGVRAMTTEHNTASQRVLERTTFQRITEGVPAEVELAGQRHRTVHYVAHLATRSEH